MAVNNIYIGESRSELISWVNELLYPTQISKVEECGKGAVYCQIMDSIYGNVAISRVKFNARTEYEYLENYKILKNCFVKNKVDKPIPVERLVKCKMQDNLEFLQWMKKWWDATNPGGGYDAAARSGGQAQISSAPSGSRAASGGARNGTSARVTTSSNGAGPARSVSTASAAQLQALNAQVAEMQEHAEAIERERDFYFGKLRSIELIVGERLAISDIVQEEKDVLAKVQEILYSTAEGFELPESEQNLEVEVGHEVEEETF